MHPRSNNTLESEYTERPSFTKLFVYILAYLMVFSAVSDCEVLCLTPRFTMFLPCYHSFCRFASTIHAAGGVFSRVFGVVSGFNAKDSTIDILASCLEVWEYFILLF